MLSSEMLLRQRYSLSFFITTLLIALTTESSLAFSITPPKEYLPVITYITPTNVSNVTLNPVNVTSITRGGTTGFLRTLSQAFKDWTFNSAPNDLAGNFQIEKYLARYIRFTEEERRIGGELQLIYNYGNGDPIPDDSGSLHWIQRVVSNHHPLGHDIDQDNIDITPGQNDPFYDTNGNADQTNFRDFSRLKQTFVIFHDARILTKAIPG